MQLTIVDEMIFFLSFSQNYYLQNYNNNNNEVDDKKRKQIINFKINLLSIKKMREKKYFVSS